MCSVIHSTKFMRGLIMKDQLLFPQYHRNATNLFQNQMREKLQSNQDTDKQSSNQIESKRLSDPNEPDSPRFGTRISEPLLDLKNSSFSTAMTLHQELQASPILQVSNSNNTGPFCVGISQVYDLLNGCQQSFSNAISRSTINIKRHKAQQIKGEIEQMKKDCSLLFQMKQPINLIDLTLQYVLNRSQSLTGVTFEQIIDCLEHLKLFPILKHYQHFEALIRHFLKSTNSSKMSLMTLLTLLFDIIGWKFEPFLQYFLKQMNAKVLQTQIFLEIQIPIIDVKNTSSIQAIQNHNFHKLLVANDPYYYALCSFLQNQDKQIIIKTLRDSGQFSNGYQNVEKQEQYISKEIAKFCTPPLQTQQANKKTKLKTQQNSPTQQYELKINLPLKNICFKLDVTAQQNLDEIVDELCTNYYLDGQIRMKIMQEIHKTIKGIQAN